MPFEIAFLRPFCMVTPVWTAYSPIIYDIIPSLPILDLGFDYAVRDAHRISSLAAWYSFHHELAPLFTAHRTLWIFLWIEVVKLSSWY